MLLVLPCLSSKGLGRRLEVYLAIRPLGMLAGPYPELELSLKTVFVIVTGLSKVESTEGNLLLSLAFCVSSDCTIDTMVELSALTEEDGTLGTAPIIIVLGLPSEESPEKVIIEESKRLASLRWSVIGYLI